MLSRAIISPLILITLVSCDSTINVNNQTTDIESPALGAADELPGVPGTSTSSIVNNSINRTATTSETLLFDGQSFNGWTGEGSGQWSIRYPGLYAGETGPVPESVQLTSTGKYLNFDLSIKVQELASSTNTGGIEFLNTTFTDSKGVVRNVAYRFGVGEGAWGNLYDDGSVRNRVIRTAPVSPLKNSSENPEIESYIGWAGAAVNDDGLNVLRLVVEYPRIRGYVNGAIAFDFTETEFETLAAVKAAIEAGAGQPIRLKALEGASLVYRGIVITELDNEELLPLGNPDFAKVGRWNPPENLGLLGVNTHLLPNGKLLIHDSTDEDNYNEGWFDNPDLGSKAALATIYDPQTESFENLDEWFLTQGEIELFCSGHTYLPNGEIVTHGNTQWQGNNVRPNVTSQATWNASVTYDYATGTWSREQDSKRAAYYPTVVGTLSGDALAFAGGTATKGKTRSNTDHTEIFNYQTRQWRMLTNNAEWSGLASYLGANLSLVNYFDTYYNVVMMPGSGKLLHLGGPSHLVGADFAGDGGAEYFNQREDIVRYYGQHQVYGNGKILYFGGGSYTHRYGSTDDAWYGATAQPNSAVVIDMNGDQPTTIRTGDLQEGRQRGVSSLLADGSVITFGGHDLSVGTSYSDSAVDNIGWSSVKLRPEIWRAETGEWNEMTPAQRRRQYHSTATLMTDGRVFVAGSGYPRQWYWFHAVTINGNDAKGSYDQYQPWDDFSYEIFEPPYLFDANGNYANRPEYLWTPPSIGYQNDFGVVMNSTESIEKLHLIKLSSQTHGVEMSSRLVELEFSQSNRVLNVDGLSDSTIAPAGHYMLIAVNNKGVPSVGKIIKVDGHLSVQFVAKATGDSIAKKSVSYIANEEVGTADFIHGDTRQSWQMNHGSWTGDQYRFISRHDLTVMDTQYLTGSWYNTPLLSTQKLSIENNKLPYQTFGIEEIEGTEYRITNRGATLDYYFTKDYQGEANQDESFFRSYNDHVNQRFYIYPTNAPTTIRSSVTGGGVSVQMGDLAEEAHGFIIQPSSSGEGKVKIAFGAFNGLAFTADGSVDSLNMNQSTAATDWVIEYLPKGLSRIKHVQSELYLSSVPHTGPFVNAGLSGVFGRVTSATFDANDSYQLWRMTN